MEKILKNKGVLINPKDGLEIIPLEQKSYDFGIDLVEPEGFYTVNKSMEMRSDIFASIYSSSMDDEWVILKYNNISNPFIISEGDVLAIPKIGIVKSMESNVLKRDKESPKSRDSKENIKDQFKKLIDFSDRENQNPTGFGSFRDRYKEIAKNGQGGVPGGVVGSPTNQTEDQLPPNFSDGAAKELKILPNGEVILGSSVATSNRDCSKKTTTKAELINALIKNRVV